MQNYIQKTFIIAALLANANLSTAAPHAHHDHGVIQLDVVIEDDKVNVSLQSPLDSFLGFERAPRTTTEKKNADNALALLRTGGLLQPDISANCTLTDSQVSAPVLEGKATEKDGHADLEANYIFGCKNISALKTMRLGFFDAFKHTMKIEVQLATPVGQSKTTVLKKNPIIKFESSR